MQEKAELFGLLAISHWPLAFFSEDFNDKIL